MRCSIAMSLLCYRRALILVFSFFIWDRPWMPRCPLAVLFQLGWWFSKSCKTCRVPFCRLLLIWFDMNLHAFLHAMLKWNLVLPFKCKKNTSSLSYNFGSRMRIFLGETQIAKRLWSTSSTSGFGQWGLWWICGLMWIDLFPWLVAGCSFHLASSLHHFAVVDLAKKWFQAAKFKPHLHRQDVFLFIFPSHPQAFYLCPGETSKDWEGTLPWGLLLFSWVESNVLKF